MDAQSLSREHICPNVRLPCFTKQTLFLQDDLTLHSLESEHNAPFSRYPCLHIPRSQLYDAQSELLVQFDPLSTQLCLKKHFPLKQ